MHISTERLRIRRLTVDDAEFVLALLTDPAFIANIGDRGVQSLADAERFIENGPWTRQQPSGYGQFAVELRGKAGPIGVCGLLFRESLDLTDIGFAFLPPYRRQGFAFEAAQAMLTYGHATLGVQKIVGLTSVANPESIRLLERLGMKFEKMVLMSGDDPGTALYS